MNLVTKTKTSMSSKIRGQRDDLLIIALFSLLLIIYLAIAYFFHAPRGYYGTIDQPRFADPWIDRSETILSGGLLYQDVFTSTPPLTNLLLVLPSLVPILVGTINPWATLSFMIFFSLFTLFSALLLIRMGANRTEGFYAAVIFLLNPLTLGNAILRRQDESIIVFFIALSLFFLIKDRHWLAGISIGLSLLVKLWGAVLIPVALLHKRDWRYLILPPVVFLIGLGPFLILAGQDAFFWDFGTSGAQHPFQFKGVSLMALWNQMNAGSSQVPLMPMAILFVICVIATAALVAWKRFGIIEDTIILTTGIFLFSPKLHTGYFSILVLLLALVIKDWRVVILYFLFGALAMVADFYKWPVVNLQVAFWLMVAVLISMVLLAVSVYIQAVRNRDKTSTLRAYT